MKKINHLALIFLFLINQNLFGAEANTGASSTHNPYKPHFTQEQVGILNSIRPGCVDFMNTLGENVLKLAQTTKDVSDSVDELTQEIENNKKRTLDLQKDVEDFEIKVNGLDIELANAKRDVDELKKK